MALQQWELWKYEQAAREVCAALNDDPSTPTTNRDGDVRPLWVSIAEQMHTMRLMQAAMNAHGLYGPV